MDQCSLNILGCHLLGPKFLYTFELLIYANVHVFKKKKIFSGMCRNDVSRFHHWDYGSERPLVK